MLLTLPRVKIFTNEVMILPLMCNSECGTIYRDLHQGVLKIIDDRLTVSISNLRFGLRLDTFLNSAFTCDTRDTE